MLKHARVLSWRGILVKLGMLVVHFRAKKQDTATQNYEKCYAYYSGFTTFQMPVFLTDTYYTM
jgi:hypothetical protein